MVVEENQFSEEKNPTLTTKTHPLGWAEPNKELDAWEKFQVEEKEKQERKSAISKTILPSGKGFDKGQVYNPDGSLMGGETPNEPASVFDKPLNVQTVGNMNVESNLPTDNEVFTSEPINIVPEKTTETTDAANQTEKDSSEDMWLSDKQGSWLNTDQKGLEPDIVDMRQKYNDKFYGVFEEAREQAKSEGYESFLFKGEIHSTETAEEKAEKEGRLKNYIHTSFSHINVNELDKYVSLKQNGKLQEAKQLKESWPEVTYNKNTYLQNNIPYAIPKETRLNLNNDMFQYDIPAGMLPGLDKNVTMTAEQIEDKYLGGKMPHNTPEDDKNWESNWIKTLGDLLNPNASVFKYDPNLGNSEPLSAEEIAETMNNLNEYNELVKTTGKTPDAKFTPGSIVKNNGLVVIPAAKDAAGNIIGKERVGIPKDADEFIRWANSINQELYRKDNIAGKEYLPTMQEGDLFSIQDSLIGKRLMNSEERASFVKTKIQSDPNYSHVLQDNLENITKENKWMLYEPLLYNSIEDNDSKTRTTMGRYLFAGPNENERIDALNRFNEYEISQGRFTYFDDIKLDPSFIPELGVDESLWQKMRSGSETDVGYLANKIYNKPGGSILDWGGSWNDGKGSVGTVLEDGNTTGYGTYNFDISGSVNNVFNVKENRNKWIAENATASLDAKLKRIPELFKSTKIIDGEAVTGAERWRNHLVSVDDADGYNRMKFNVFTGLTNAEDGDFDRFMQYKKDYENALKTGDQEKINEASEQYFGIRQRLELGSNMYDYKSGKIYNVEDKETPIYVKEANEDARMLSITNNKEGLENMRLYKAEELRFFIKEVVQPQINDYGYDSFESGETAVASIARSIGDFVFDDSKKADINAIKKAAETGDLHHTLTNLPGRHPVADNYNRLLSELMVLDRALVLNEDVTSPFNEPGRFAMGTLSNFAGQKTKYAGDFKYQDMADTLANPYSGVFSQYGLKFDEQKFSESQHASFSELAFGLIPDLAQFAGEVYMFKKFTGNTINNITKSLTSRMTASSNIATKTSNWWARNPWTKKGLTTALAANAEGLTFVGSEYTFGGITKFEDDLDYSGSYRFGFGLGVSGKVGQGIIKSIPAKHWFSPITAQLSKSQTLVNFNQNLMGGSVAGMSFITTGEMEALYQEAFDDQAGINWDNVGTGFTMKHISAEILKMMLFQKMHSPFAKNGLMRGIQTDIQNFQGRIPGSKRAAEFFYKDLGFESWKDFHREYAGDKVSRKATQEDVNNGLAKKEGDVIYNEGNGKKIEDLYKSEFNKIINGEGKYAGLNAKERGKKASELKEHVINLEGAQQFNALRTSIAKERKNGNFPTDTEMHVLINRIKEGQSIEKWSVEDFNAYAKLPIAGILGRLGLNPKSKQAKDLIELQKDAMGLMEALDKSVFKTPRGSKERTAAFNFLMERSKIHNQIEDLQNKKKEDKSLDVDKKIENLQNKLKEMQEGGSRYNKLMTSIENKYKEKYEQDRKDYVDRRKAMGQKFNMVEVGKKDFKTGNYEKGKNEFQKEYKKATGQKDNVKDNPAFIHPVTGKIYVNYARAMEVKNASTIFHEDIHFQTKNVLKDANGLVTDKGIKIIDGALKELTPLQLQEVEQKINDNYKFDDKGRKLDKKEYYDEYLTVMGEMMKDKKISYTDTMGDKLADLLPVLKNVFPNLSTKGEGVGRQMFDVIKGLAEKPLQLDNLKKLQEGTVKPGSRADIMNMKIAAGQMGQTRPIPKSKERTKEEQAQDAKIKDLLIRYKEGAKSPENIKEIERLEGIKKTLESKGKKISPELQKEIDALKNLEVDASVLKELKAETLPLLKKFQNMFRPELGGDVASARIAIENTLEKLYDTYKPIIDGKPNPVEFIGYATPLMRKRMAAIFEKYGFKEVPKDLLSEGGIKEEKLRGKIDPVSLVRNPDIGIVNEIQSNLPANLEGKSFSNLGNLAMFSTSKIYGIPVKKLKNKQDNLNQKETEDAQNALVSLGLRESFKLKPEKNVAPQEASENVRGRSLNIDTSLLNAKDIISGKNKPLFVDTDKRASGKGSQPYIKEKNNKLSEVEYNSMFGILPKNHPSGISKINNPKKAGIFLFGKEAVEKGLTKEQKKEARAFFNKIGQRLKAEANLFGTLSTNTTVRKLKFKDEGIVNVLNDIALGKSKAMFSKEQDLKEANDIKNKYKLNESQFVKSFETILDNGELKNKELQQDLEQLSVNVSKTEFYAEIARNKNFKKKFQEERLNTDFDKNFAERLNISTKEATKLLNELQDSNASFIDSNGKLDNKDGYKKFSEQWGDYYKFWGEMGAEFGMRRKGTNLTKFFEQITWVGERTTGKGKDFDLIGDSGKNKQTVQFNIDKSKKSLRDVIENHKDLNEAQKKDLLEQFDNIDFTKIDPAIIAKQDRWRKLIEQEATVSKKIKDLQKEIPQGHVENMGNVFNLLKTMERYWFESKEGSGKLDAARFLYQTSRMNSNLVFGQRSTFGNKYFYIAEGFQGMGMKNPIWAEAYNEAIETAKKDPSVLTKYNRKKKISETITAEEYAKVKANNAAKFKGEHASDSATVQLNTWVSTVTGKGTQGIGTLNLNNLIQVAAPKVYLDIIDKALGTNAEGGILRFIADSRVRSELSKFKKPFGGDLLQDVTALSKKLLKENPAFTDHILNDKFLNSSSTSTTLKAKTRNKKQTVTNHKNMVDVGNIAGVNTKNVSTSQIFNKISNLDKAMRMSFSKDKGLSGFDFDDTVARSKSKVLYTLPNGTKGKLNATEFARRSESLEAKGAKFDFSQFSKVIDGKKGPLFEKLENAINKFGNENVFIVTARPQSSAKAIHNFLKGMGVNLKLENIVGLENGSPQAKADWFVGKVKEGFNDIYFVDDAAKNVKAVDKVIKDLNLKGRSAAVRFSKEKDLNKEVNAMIEYSKGIGKEKTYTATKGRLSGKDKKGTGFYLPSRAEDFMGLVRPLFGKGKQGMQNEKWWNDNFTRSFSKGTKEFQTDQRTRMSDYRALRREFKENVLEEKGQNTFVERNKFWKHPLKEKISSEKNEVFTNEHAARVYNWAKQGITAKELNISKKDFNRLVDYVDKNGSLKSFADQLVVINKGDGYPKPTELWATRGVNFDMRNSATSVKREKYFKEFNENVDVVFSEQNLNKMEAVLGTPWRKSMENMLFRMKTGSNRPSWARGDKWESNALDWLNLSVNDVMFLNTRSALLQQVSMGNYVNYSDNNIFKASKAFANQPQFWKDYITLMNSEWALNRREGLKFNIQESEIVDAASNTKNRSAAALQLALSKGFIMTKYADSHATAFGGAAFYRNRINTYTKKGFSEKEAKKKAIEDWMELSDQNQQSARADKISNEQASLLGRFTLNFNNVTLQYGRLAKKDIMDMVNGRVDGLLKGNNSVAAKIARVSYYMGMQNAIFYGLQNAMFVTFFDDDIGEKLMDTKQERVVNGMLDNILIGSGIYGKIAATVKNFGVKLYKESGKNRPKYSDAAWELTKVSPPVDIKLRKFRSALKTLEYNMDDIKTKGFSLDNPALSVTAKMIEGATNAPTDRILRKTLNIESALQRDREMWQRAALLSGFADYDLGIEDESPVNYNPKMKPFKSKFKNTGSKMKPFKSKFKN